MIKLDKAKVASEFVRCLFCDKAFSVLEVVLCSGCDKKFCLQHRHKVDHACTREAEPTNEATPEALERQKMIKVMLERIRQSKVGAGVVLKNKGRKDDALALKVAMMKLKSTAVGQASIPQAERFYNFVTFVPNEHSFGQDELKIDKRAIYMCREWSVGRCVDWIAQQFKLINKNNIQSQPKLVLTTEDLLASTDGVQPCCVDHTGFICFPHTLKALEADNVIKPADHLIVTYFK